MFWEFSLACLSQSQRRRAADDDCYDARFDFFAFLRFFAAFDFGFGRCANTTSTILSRISGGFGTL
jgi:hypothetical protein